jgi:FkbM family methyltransferase
MVELEGAQGPLVFALSAAAKRTVTVSISSPFFLFMLRTKDKIAIANVARMAVRVGQRLVGRGSVGVHRRGGVNYELDLDEGIDFSIYLLGAFEVETSRACVRRLQPGHVVLDIGANIGAHTLPFANAVGPQGRVHAFEPTDFATAKLRRNLELNPALAPRVVINQVFLGDGVLEGPPEEICSSWPLQGAADVQAARQGVAKSTRGATATSLDEYAREHALDRVDLIKLDVDGNEAGVLRGGLEVLQKFRPPILMELGRDDDESAALRELLQLLENLQAAVYSVSGKKRLSLDESSLHRLIPVGGSINVFVHPFEK